MSLSCPTPPPPRARALPVAHLALQYCVVQRWLQQSATLARSRLSDGGDCSRVACLLAEYVRAGWKRKKKCGRPVDRFLSMYVCGMQKALYSSLPGSKQPPNGLRRRIRAASQIEYTYIHTYIVKVRRVNATISLGTDHLSLATREPFHSCFMEAVACFRVCSSKSRHYLCHALPWVAWHRWLRCRHSSEASGWIKPNAAPLLEPTAQPSSEPTAQPCCWIARRGLDRRD